MAIVGTWAVQKVGVVGFGAGAFGEPWSMKTKGPWTHQLGFRRFIAESSRKKLEW